MCIRDRLSLLADPQQLRPPLLAQYLKLDGQIIAYLLADDTLDARLTSCCEWAEPTATFADLPVGSELKKAITGMAIQARERQQSLRLYLQGPPGVGKRGLAEALAGLLGAPLLVADLARTPIAVEEFAAVLTVLFRTALLQEAMLYCTGFDTLLADVYKRQKSYAPPSEKPSRRPFLART